MSTTGEDPGHTAGDQPDPMSRAERVFDALLDAAHLAGPHEVPGLIAEHAVLLGAVDAVVYLVDLQQTLLVPFLGSAGRTELQHETLSVESTVAGRAFRLTEVVRQPLAGGKRGGTLVWLPVLDGTERLGVLGVVLARADGLDAPDGLLARRLRRLAGVVGELVMTKTLYGDTIVQTRRQVPMSLAAEVQWGLLPPLTFASQDVTVAGMLEPAYRVAGDTIDYAVDHGVARLAVFDGMGHGLAAAGVTTFAVAAYRHARRRRLDLPATYTALDEAVLSQFGGDRHVTAGLARLDLGTGRLA